jgi:FixJ family two-component response regulator
MQSEQHVYIVDSDPRVANQLARPLAATGCRVTSVASAQAFLADVCLHASSCALLDLDLPDQDGFAVLEQLQRRKLAIPIIFTTARGDIATCVRAMRAGVVDFLIKPLAYDELLDSIARALAIGMHWRAALAEEALACELLARLTIRERQVLELVLAGRRNKEIATALASQEATIKVHRSRLMRKLEVRSLVELVRFGRYLAPLRTVEPELRLPRRAEIIATAAAVTDAAQPSAGVDRYLAHYGASKPGAGAPYSRSTTANPWADAVGTWTDFSWICNADAETAR